MSQLQNIEFMVQGLQVQSQGQTHYNRPDIQVEVNDAALINEAKEYIRYVAAYVQQSGVQIKPGETLMYGYWPTQFRLVNDQLLEVWEHVATTKEWVRGASLTLTYWRDQQTLCVDRGVPFVPPRPDQLVVLSAGVIEGDPVEGVRYPSPQHMSGWWITTDRYHGDTKSLTLHHMYHITAVRPDVARFIALPFGYRFALQDREYIWFDKNVAQASAE